MNKLGGFYLQTIAQNDYILTIRQTPAIRREFLLICSSCGLNHVWNRVEGVWNSFKEETDITDDHCFDNWRQIWNLMGMMRLPNGEYIEFVSTAPTAWIYTDTDECSGQIWTLKHPHSLNDRYAIIYYTYRGFDDVYFVWDGNAEEWVETLDWDKDYPLDRYFPFPHWIQAWNKAEDALQTWPFKQY